ncbi:hypothetical protein FHS42_004767 [Streptomyces zagrosensis]|uniref:Uncharacterized protein n=1 Tax=Streptomyces zagrosensis TaxID=1042984 RepID=A0A7W9QCP3_9ACTN|nr:hypothetical protein [Streptomyces zagrosensis]
MTAVPTAQSLRHLAEGDAQLAARPKNSGDATESVVM